MPELHDIFLRFWDDLMSRPNGPYGVRFILQPLTAAVVAIIDGIRDAHSGRAPYLWTILSTSGKRKTHLHEGIKATARILIAGMAMEVLYQVKTLHTFYIGEAIVIVICLAFLPYLLLRGPATRIARYCIARREKGTQP
ncbi:hypothetical protein [Oxalicibacterium solurbis]|uniref:Transmembrane protein n=1 Tax=Oxalicibacterium solurbis TaxID=69280 RepID=A0A8J3F2S7_9BURK|nr:hypothetical protein [Oxalicibacterium solurbis]GGI52847.1 hypothetical protein GCM10011430_00210 [Oxalicibacterium solurbis]